LAEEVTFGTKNRRLDAQLHRRECHGHAVVATRGGNYPDRRHLAHEKIGERAADLKRSRMLHQLELQTDGGSAETEIGGVDLDDRSTADMRPDQLLGRGNALTGDFAAHLPFFRDSLVPAGRGRSAARADL
jgi:hypothetical protein